MVPGTLIQITEPGPWGTMESLNSRGFADEIVRQWYTGEYVGLHPELPDWHMLKFETRGGTRYCPMPEGTFETQ